jgi:hypothetical protein
LAANGLKSLSLMRGQAPEKIITLLLLFFLLTAAVAGVTGVLTGPDWNALWKGLIFGLLVGWLLAIFQQPPWRSIPLMAFLGTCYALLYVGGLRQKTLAVLSEFFFIVSRFATSSGVVPGDASSIKPPIADFLNTSGVILERVRVWVLALVMKEPVFDPVAAAFVWILLVWLIAAWAGWAAIAHKNALLATLPVILVSVATLAYGRSESVTLYVMLGLTLLVVATVQHTRREQGWEEVNTAYPPRKGRQIGINAVTASVALVLLSAVVSSISLPRIVEWVSASRGTAVQGEDNLAKSLGIISRAAVTPDPFKETRHPGLPRASLIGSGPELSHRIVMTMAVKNYPSKFSSLLQPPYWRSFTYDTYTGNGWESGATTTSQYQVNQLLGPEQAQGRILLEQTMRPVAQDSTYLFAAGDPVAVNLSSEVARRSPDDLFGILLGSTGSYEARSLISVADEQSLRAERYGYPNWVRQRFLDLPPDIPSRVKELALQLTASAPTPYDRVRAIEQYLRAIPYTLDIPYPPQDQDLVDYFLFDLRKGYCDYYASAMVVLSRAAGVPSRFVIGYANGTYDLKSERFLVTEADAHAWVEVYFPGAGWVPFEPTAGRPPLSKSTVTESNLEVSSTIPEEMPRLVETSIKLRGWHLLVGVLFSIALFGITWVTVDEIRMRIHSEFKVAGEIYLRLRRFGAHLGAPLLPGDTPYEYQASLISRLEDLSQHGVPPEISSKIYKDLSKFTNRIVEASFIPAYSQGNPEKLIFTLWKRLRGRLSLMLLVKYYQSTFGRLLGAQFHRSSKIIVNSAGEDQPR